jgi:hypothetical protein
MDEPPEQDDPHQRCQNKLNNRKQQPALQQLSQTRNKKTAEGGDNISRRSLAWHGAMVGRIDRHHKMNLSPRVRTNKLFLHSAAIGKYEIEHKRSGQGKG